MSQPDHDASSGASPAGRAADDPVTAIASFQQRRLWLLDRLYGQQAAYNVGSPYRLTGPLDVKRLQRSLDAVVRRHEALRTCFRFEAGDLIQVVLPTLCVPITLRDLQHAPASARFEMAVRETALEFVRPFDLERAPLVRVTLYRSNDQDHLLAFCVHHAVFDGWSERLFLEELAATYRSDADCDPGKALEELPVQYVDFARWQRAQAASPAAQAGLALWHERLTGAPTALNLPADYRRPRQATRRGGREVLLLPPKRVAAVNGVGRAHGVTLFTTLLAAYAVVLHRYSGDAEVMIGTALAGRTRPEFEGLIGFFINTVALRADLRGQPAFAEVLDRVKRVSLEAQTLQDVPFERIVEQLHPDRTAGQMPLFQTMFVLQLATGPMPSFGDVGVACVDIHSGTSKCDLLLSVQTPRDGRDGLCCSLEYDTDLFTAETAGRLLASYDAVLDAVSIASDQPIATIPLVAATDLALIDQWSGLATEPSRDSTIHREVALKAASAPSDVALTYRSESLTYERLDARANQLARHLRGAGVTRGELVGMCLERSLDAIVAQLSILKAGAAYLPLDPSYPAARLTFMLQDAGARIVLTQAETTALVSSGTSRVIALDEVRDAIAQELCEGLPEECGADDLAYVMYTSGSTGRPNGVRIPHRGVLRLVLGSDYVNWEQATTFLQMAPLSFDASTFEVWGALLHGRRLVLFPDRVPTVATLDSVLQTEGVDCLWLTAALFNAVIDERPQCLTGVSQLIVGGEALSVPHVVKAQAQLPSTQLINGYGPTECTTFACCYPIPRHVAGDADSIPIGRPIGRTAVQVLDAQGQPVPIGVIGELYLGGDGVALGYHGRPALTAERFVVDPRGKTSRRWYRTGDCVRWRTDGVLEFHGRIDRQLKIRGLRVEPGEIEATCREHPGVRDAVVLLERHSATDARLIAFICGTAGRAVAAHDVKRFLADRLPAYLVPADVVVLDTMPLTQNDKVDREALLSMRRSSETASATVERPRGATEQALSRLWCELLQRDSIGIHDDFFALGGHSLLAVRLFSRIHDTLGQSLPFSSLLRHSTIAELAALLEPRAAQSAPSPSLVPLRREGSRPPLFLLHGVGGEVWTFVELAKQLNADQPVYGVRPTMSATDHSASIAEMAIQYVADLEAALPHGPFVLGGYCAGAVAAFEVARQLRARGRTVALLVIFDYSLTTMPAGVSFFTNLAHWVVDDLFHTTLSDNISRLRSRLRLLRTRVLRLVHDAAPAEDVRDLLGMWRFPDHEVGRLQRGLEAVRGYRFAQYDGPIHVFRARTHALGQRPPTPDLGWGNVATGPLTIEVVPGAHGNIFSLPFVRTLGERLNAVLTRTFSDVAPRHESRRRVTHDTPEGVSPLEYSDIT